ncbi:MAG TPA: glycosyltransferase family 1 protein [Actinomycetota bacterium]|nr:glycosyltransferase family 1 protein [Actinomycetota bacterium]
MQVVIDARSATAPHRTGVGRYTWQLVRRLPVVDPSTRYVAWYLNAGGVLTRRRFFPDVDASNLIEHGTPIPARWFNRAVARLDLPRMEWFVRGDAVFGPNFVPPPTRAQRVVVTVHDLGFHLLPSTALHAVPWWLRTLERTLTAGTRVIVPSNATADDVQEHYGVERDRIEVIPLGVDANVFHPRDHDDVRGVRDRYGIDGPYVLFVGLEGRKNLQGMLDAFARVQGSVRPRLVLAGRRPWDPNHRDTVAEALARVPANVRDDITLTGYVSEHDASALLAGAELLAYPSLYEGFGLPVLEAMASGTPVLASNVSSLPELADGAAVLVDPHDPDAIAAGIESLLQDAALRARLRSAGLERARAYDWDVTARRTAGVLRSAAAG